MHGHICSPRLYEYEGHLFEFSGYNGPWPCKKDGSLMKNITKDFWDMWERFDKLTEEEKQKFRVGGGCVSF